MNGIRPGMTFELDSDNDFDAAYPSDKQEQL